MIENGIYARNMIRLNFLPLSEQNFEFKVYRKKHAGERKEGEFENLYLNTLPIDPNKTEDREKYWISFEPKNDFEEFICKQDHNHKLTQHLLFSLLTKKAKESLASKEYIIPEKIFRRQIYFVLREHKEGKETVWLEPYYLKPKRKFGFLVDFKFRKNPEVEFSRVVQMLSLSLDKDFRSNRNFYIDKYQKIREFLNKFRDKIFPLKFGELEIDILVDFEDLPYGNLDIKNYIFANNNKEISQYRGLEKYGPLEEVKKDVIFVCIYRDEDRYLLDDLINALNGKSHIVPFKGVKRIFNLNVTDTVYIPLHDFSKESLDEAINSIISIKQENNSVLVMPIFIMDKNDEDTYYYLKYMLLNENMPIQVVTVDLLRRRSAFKWSISNIALQIFAKLGGKPWQVLPSHKDSIILGIGQAHKKIGDKIVKYFAYSVCTDSSGIYKKIDVLGKSDDEKSYLEQLRENILDVIEENINGSHKKIILHIPFKIKKNELETINGALKEIASQNNSDIDFVVLKVNQKNKFFGYAYTNSLVPYESSYVVLSNNPKEYLVWFEGLQYHRETIYKRIPGPIHIEFYWSNRKLTEDERIKYLQDVLNLSGANWRGFNAKNLPISIYYCQLIANFLKKFPEDVENIEHIPAPWFL